MKSSKTLIFSLLSASAVAIQVYEPRRLTPEEAKINVLLPIDDLLTPKNYSEDTSIEKQVLRHVPKGLNKDKGWNDADLRRLQEEIQRERERVERLERELRERQQREREERERNRGSR